MGGEPLKTAGVPIVFEAPVRWEVLDRCWPMLRALAMEAPPLVNGVMVVTSTLRKMEPGDPWSYHFSGHAVDVRTGIQYDATRVDPLTLYTRPGAIIAAAVEDAIVVADRWRSRVARRLGSEYDVIFGAPDHWDHIHTEHDQRKAARSYKGETE